MVSLTRVYQFSASHRLHSPALSQAENARVFGKCNNPYGHGHNYALSVTVAGEVDKVTGRLINVRQLDDFVQLRVLNLFLHRNINEDVPQFAELVPTTENVALVIANLLQQDWAEFGGEAGPRLHRVHVQETDRNGFEVLMPVLGTKKKVEIEDLLVHA